MSDEEKMVRVKDLVTTAQAARRLRISTQNLHQRRSRYEDHPQPVFDHPMLTIWDMSELRRWQRRRWPVERAQRTLALECPLPAGHSHGTRSDYVTGCRCADSREANSEYIKTFRAKKRDA